MVDRSRKKPGDAGSTPMSHHHEVRRGTKDKKTGRKPAPVTTAIDLDQIPDNQLPLLAENLQASGVAPTLHRSMSDGPR